MEQQQENPIHWDQHSSRWNITLIFALVVAVLGIMTGYILTALGLAMAVYSWLTTPRQYLLYRDRMMIVYGMPRTRVISFAEISHVEVLALPFGERLRLRFVDGKRMMLAMRDPSAFLGHLEDTLIRYHKEQTGQGYVESYGSALASPGEAGWDGEAGWETEEELAEAETSRAEKEDSPGETGPYAGRVEEAASASGSYTEFGEAASESNPAPVDDRPSASGSYTESGEAVPESNPAPVDDRPSASGSYTEAPAPGYSGEDRPAAGAEVDLDTGRSGESEEQERPPSPY